MIRLQRAQVELNGFMWAEGYALDQPFAPGRTSVRLAVFEPQLSRQPALYAVLHLDFRKEDEVEELRARVAELEASEAQRG
jgi:hypothetical protein